MSQIYKITYPNGKIYIGSDTTDDCCYFGSVNSDLVRADFPVEQLKLFTITKYILWEGSCTVQELRKLENQFILDQGSYKPEVGYNRSHGERPKNK